MPRRGQGDQPAASPAAKCNTSGRAQLSNAKKFSNAQKQSSSVNVPPAKAGKQAALQPAKQPSRQDLSSANVPLEHDSDNGPICFRNLSAAQRGDVEVGESSDEETLRVCGNSYKATPSRNPDPFRSQAGFCNRLDNAKLSSADFPSSTGEQRSTSSSSSP